MAYETPPLQGPLKSVVGWTSWYPFVATLELWPELRGDHNSVNWNGHGFTYPRICQTFMRCR